MKETEENSNIELLEVKLKPILGIAPKIYVFFITIILLLSLVSILIIIPKFKNPGAYLKINSNIANTYIYLNEKYIGRTPLNKYINTTEGIIKAKRMGFKTYEQNIKINNKFFGSYNLQINLELVDPEKIIKQRQKELSIMVKIKNINENTKLIPVFSLISSELKEHPKYIKQFLKNSIPYLNSIEMFKDFLNSYKVVYSIDKSNNITGISYFSAIEYANWYSKKLPNGFKARLPISQEWELYQKEPNKKPLNINEISKKVGFWNLMQNSSFNDIAIFKNEKNFYNENSNFYSLITEIRTYSHQNNNLLNPSTKASFLKNWSSPNIGFRLIVSKE